MNQKDGQSKNTTPRIMNTLRQIVQAVKELGKGVNQGMVARHLGFSSGAISKRLRQAISMNLLKNSGVPGGHYFLEVTAKGHSLIGEPKPAPITPPGTTSVEEIILRLSRTIERLLEENDRLKPENERLLTQEQRLTAEGEELLRDNLRLEEEIKSLKEQVDSYKEEAVQLRQLRTPAKTDLVPRVAHAMAVFGD